MQFASPAPPEHFFMEHLTPDERERFDEFDAMNNLDSLSDNEQKEYNDLLKKGQNPFRAAEDMHERGRASADAIQQVVAAIDGVAQAAFATDRGAVAATADDYVKAVEQKDKNPDVRLFEGNVNGLKYRKFGPLLRELTARIIGVSEALMREARFPQNHLTIELAHHKEVIGLALKFAESAQMNQSDTLRTVLAAAVHDMAKYARRVDAPESLLRDYDAKKDSFFSLFNHEILSARMAAELGQTLLLSENTEIHMRNPEKYAAILAGTAGGHGRGEFPQEKARIMAFTAFGAEADYYDIRLPENDPAALAVHLSDVIQGEFGRNINGWGGSYLKYFSQPPVKNVDEHFFNGPTSVLNSSFKNYVEVLRSLDASPSTPQSLAQAMQNEADEQIGAAYGFADWIRTLPPEDARIALLNDKLAEPKLREKVYAQLLANAEEAGVFSNDALRKNVESFQSTFDAKLTAWEAELRRLLPTDSAVTSLAGELTMQEAERQGKWEVAKYLFIQEKLALIESLKGRFA